MHVRIEPAMKHAFSSFVSVYVRIYSYSLGNKLLGTHVVNTPFKQNFGLIYTSSKFERDKKGFEVSHKLGSSSIALFDDLASEKKATKELFLSALQLYIAKQKTYRRGHVEFIYAALSNMKRFGVHRDLDMYKSLLEVFPQGVMIAQTMWQREFQHYPKQQQCAIDLMDEMEYFGVIPDRDFGIRLSKIFGQKCHTFYKYRRMMYWLPKLKNLNPYSVKDVNPDDNVSLAVGALKRMSVDKNNEITVWNCSEDQEATEDTFIVSAQSPTQQELIEKHNQDLPLFVVGGFCMWLLEKQIKYFVLRSDPDLRFLENYRKAIENIEMDNNLFEWTNFWEDEDGGKLAPLRSFHEQDDGTILAMTITGTSSKASLVSWIRCLQIKNPALVQLPVVFKISSPEVDANLEVIETAKT